MIDLHARSQYQLIRAALLLLRDTGSSVDEIARKAKCSKSCVYAWCQAVPKNRRYIRHEIVMGLLRAIGCTEAFASDPNRNKRRTA